MTFGLERAGALKMRENSKINHLNVCQIKGVMRHLCTARSHSWPNRVESPAAFLPAQVNEYIPPCG